MSPVFASLSPATIREKFSHGWKHFLASSQTSKSALGDNKPHHRGASTQILRIELAYQDIAPSLTVNQRAPLRLLNLSDKVHNETYYHARSKVGSADI